MQRQEKYESKSRISFSVQRGTQTDVTGLSSCRTTDDSVILPVWLFNEMAKSHFVRNSTFNSIGTMTDPNTRMIEFIIFFSQSVKRDDVFQFIDEYDTVLLNVDEDEQLEFCTGKNSSVIVEELKEKEAVDVRKTKISSKTNSSSFQMHVIFHLIDSLT